MNRDNVSRTGETTDGETEAGSVRCDTAGIAADHGAPRGSSSARPAASCVIRPLRDDETELLKDFLYECIFVPDGKLPPRDIIERPEFRVYTDDFGTGPADNCLVAEVDGKVVGAVWTRIMNDYGHVDDETPSFAIALHKEYRGQGIGTRLMVQMLRRLKQQGYRRASLSVQRANYAVRMYEKVGFEVLRKNEEEYIMVRDLHSAGL